jgi:phage-related protein
MWLAGEVKTPPMSLEARREMGFLLRCLQEGDNLSLPLSRPMPFIGRSCHELRVNDERKTWRLFYLLDTDADRIVILDVIEKKTQKTSATTINTCIQRRKSYENLKRSKGKN